VSAADDAEELSRLVREINTSASPAVRRADAPALPPRAARPPQPREPHVDHAHLDAVDAVPATSSAARAHLDLLLQEAVRRGASDLLLVTGVAPTIRRHGASSPSAARSPSRAPRRAPFVLDLLDDLRYREFLRTKAADFTFERPGSDASAAICTTSGARSAIAHPHPASRHPDARRAEPPRRVRDLHHSPARARPVLRADRLREEHVDGRP
jgi:hypothetical protein